MVDSLDDILIAFTSCVGQAPEGICSYGITIGDQYVPFDPDPGEDEDCEDSDCSQVWTRIMGVSPKEDPNTQGWEGNCAPLLELQIEVGVMRCFEIMEEGEAPTASQVLIASMQAMDDMGAIYEAAMGCEVWEGIDAGTWLPFGPLGGQYGGMWTFVVEIDANCVVSRNTSI